MAQTLAQLDQKGGQELARGITESIQKGEVMFGVRLVKLISEVFPGPESAQKFFATVKDYISQSADLNDAVIRYDTLKKQLMGKGRAKEVSLLNTIIDQYSAREPGLGRGQSIYELYTSPSLTKEIADYWPKMKK